MGFTDDLGRQGGRTECNLEERQQRDEAKNHDRKKKCDEHDGHGIDPPSTECLGGCSAGVTKVATTECNIKTCGPGRLQCTAR